MAGWEGRGSLFQIGDMTPASGVAISAVSISGGIATVTATSHGLANNDIIEITGVVGTLNINDYHLVRVVDADSFSLDGSFNITGTYTSGGTSTKQNGAYTTIASMLTEEDGEQDDEIDVSAVDTPQGFREFRSGMTGADFTFTGNWRPNNATHGMITGLYYVKRSRTPTWFRQTFPQVSTTQAPAKAFLGLLQNLREAWDAEGKVTLTGSGRITSARLMMPGQ